MTGFCCGLAFFAQRARFAFRDSPLGFCALPDCFGVKFCFLPCECLFFEFLKPSFWFVGFVEEFSMFVELDAAHMISPFMK